MTLAVKHRVGLSIGGNDELTGTLDELTIHERNLSPEEIKILAARFDTRGEGFGRLVLPSGAAGSAPRMDLGALETTSAIAEAKSLVVNSLADSVDAFDGVTSLREAIAHANDTTFNGGDADGDGFARDTITFAPIAGGQTITLVGGELLITQSAIIDASTVSGPVTIDANGNSRVIKAINNSTSLELNTVNIRGGRTTTDGLIGGGGGIRFESIIGKLTLKNSDVVDNRTTGQIAHGGGVFTKGDLVVMNSNIYGNETEGAQALGGGIYADHRATITDSTIALNQTHGVFANGAGIFGDYITTITNSTIAGNIAYNALGAGIHW